ncbi:phage major capsid protein [Nitrosomonas communis]|uniref:Phage major capsid protein, HK97 family n=1 Tax=Nitrosomonas communis TaxID=44574 RepID=A0A1I4UUK4_9PROT|nr:phage major capsid protein [Nitrosomonas communis]SFM92674.1 phage major capsid protein, HK97 family [Nitrosomonas communis]
MMSGNIKALREQKQELARQAKDMLAKAGDKVWTPEEKSQFDGIADQIESIESQIGTMQRLLDERVEKEFLDAKPIDPKDKAAKFARNSFDKLLRNGERALSVEEYQSIHNTMSTTTTTEGGYTVQSEVASELIEKLKGFKGMREVASQLTTSQGNPLSYPTSDGTSETGEIIAENTTATDADPSFGTVALNVFKFSSKIITIPFELLQDTNIDIIGMINSRISTRIGRYGNTMFTTGNNSGQPNGLISASSVGKTRTTGQTLTVIYEDLVDLVDSIDYAYHDGTLRFMFSQTMRKTIRKIKDTAGRPIWTPSYDAGIAGGFTDELLGHPIQLNNDVAVPAANAKSIAFGDLSKYMIRDAMLVTMFRFDDSAYAKKGQVGFMGWARMGGNLLGPNAVKLYQHSAS